ncbi:hypothetical protein IVB27_34035 [Bradyrhizobium sp. 197]|uniref:hypothetical protein n=1 Tax=unclassified Bradyrhizobium TaxID=2631580 RepID=UPI0018DF0001|nr:MULTISPECIES: hypothetical protein [unclassified Bradyrhizobium]MCK1479632.1 hypothetical protein [Bradyrhizobium sp. 197]
MADKVCNAAAALTFNVVVVGGVWSISNSYFSCGLALVAAIFARRAVERSFIKRAHRDMLRIHGADWGCADHMGTRVADTPSSGHARLDVQVTSPRIRADGPVLMTSPASPFQRARVERLRDLLGQAAEACNSCGKDTGHNARSDQRTGENPSACGGS